MHLESKNDVSNQSCFFCNNTRNHIKGRILDAPLVLGCALDNKTKDDFISFNVYQCDVCGLVFTDTNLDEVAYSAVHSEAVGGIWNEHHEQLTNFIKSEMKNLGLVLEIGPSNNPISRENTVFVDLFEKVPFELKNNEEYHYGRFPDFYSDKKFVVILASHVFEHSLDPKKFLLKCKDLLEEEGAIFISIPNFDVWINEKYWNGITPEHQIYPTIKQIEEICKKLNLKIKFKKFKNHSIFFKITISNEINEEKPYEAHLRINEWISSINNSVDFLESKLSKYDNSKVFIAGASHISQYPILMSNIIKNRINNVLDNSKSKHEKRLYGTKVYCKSFEHLKNIESPVVVVFSSPYQKEMIEQILSINKNAIIIEC